MHAHVVDKMAAIATLSEKEKYSSLGPCCELLQDQALDNDIDYACAAEGPHPFISYR